MRGAEPVDLDRSRRGDALRDAAHRHAADATMHTEMMLTALQTRYGGPETLTITQRPWPAAPTKSWVRVRVRATAVLRGDWHLMHGKPYLVRVVGFGLRRPKQPTPGMLCSGIVESTGEGVERLAVGDEVFGEVKAGLAEFAIGDESRLAKKPESMDFERAAALAGPGTTALQAIRAAGGIEPGQRVLITGASGAVGSTAVQIAKAMGAEVTATCRPSKHDRVAAIGADQVIDPQSGAHLRPDRYDRILDTAAADDRSRLRRSLREGGACTMVALGHDRFVGGLPKAMFAALRTGSSKRRFKMLFAQTKSEDLQELAALVSSGRLEPIIDSVFTLREAADAFRRLDATDLVGAPVVRI